MTSTFTYAHGNGEAAEASPRGQRPRKVARRRADRLVGNSRAIQRASEQINVAARGRFPVWIQGEPGFDKETIARLIHEQSEWATGPFFGLDAAIVPPTLLGRELFGCVEGAISSLPAAAEGALRRMRGGTVLIENIDAMPKELQHQLAAALERGEGRPLGGETPYAIECRLIASSTRPLEVLTGEGRLSPELTERVRLLEIVLPPLRERREDILPIAAQELSIRAAEIEYESGRPCIVRGFSREALERLRNHHWPGDERELREQVRAAIGMARSSELGPEDLMLSWDSSEQVPSFRDAKRAFEQEYVTRVLRLCNGNISRAARIARKDRKDFYDVMRRNAINPSDFRS
jgi:two-component system, NtrC family, response regulator GlrR